MRSSPRCGPYQPERAPDAAQRAALAAWCAADPGPILFWRRVGLCGAAQRTLHRVRDTLTYTASTPHHSAMNSAVALVDCRKESRSTYSLKPCVAAPLAPKHRLGML